MPSSCHACVLLRHLLIVCSYNALVYRLIGRIDDAHEHTATDSWRAYTNTTHSCTRQVRR